MHPSHGHDQTIVNGISRIGYMTGGKAALWKDEDMADVFTRKATAFIEQHRAKPFFLFFATHEPHVPRVPHPRFVGATAMGPRGDAIAQLDWSVGQVLADARRLGLAGTRWSSSRATTARSVDDGYRDEAVEKLGGHTPAGPFRGGKYSNFEGGTRVPFMVRWPARVKPGVSDALVSQVDFLASFAALVGPTRLRGRTTREPRDSENVLPALLGDVEDGADRAGRAGGLACAQAGAVEVHPAEPGAAHPAEHEHGNGQRPGAAALRSRD